MESTVLLTEIKRCRVRTSSEVHVKFLRQCLFMRTLHLYLIQMQYIENHFNESIQMQLGLYKRLEKMCVTVKKKILKGCRQSSPDNSDLSQCYHPTHTSKKIPNNSLA